MLCPSVSNAKTPWSSFPKQVPTSPHSSVNFGHLLMFICITALFSQSSGPAWLFYLSDSSEALFVSNGLTSSHALCFGAPPGPAPVCFFFFFSKKWNIELRSVRVSCCSPAGDFESEVNEYLTDTHEAVSYSEAEQARLWSAETWCSALQNISTPKSSRCLLRRGPPPVGSLSVCALNFLM